MVACVSLAGCYPDCPARDDVVVTYSIHTDIIEDAGAILFDGDVEVTGVTERTGQWDIDVTGPDFEGVDHDIRLTVETTPTVEIPIEAGETLRMQYVQDEPLWTNTFVSIWRDGELLLGLMDQAIVVKSEMWMDPLHLAVKRGYCPRRSDDCGARERAGIRFTHPDGHKELVMDHGTSTLLGSPSYRMLVERATLNYDSLFVPCPNRERGWLRTLVVRISS